MDCTKYFLANPYLKFCMGCIPKLGLVANEMKWNKQTLEIHVNNLIEKKMRSLAQ